MEPALESSAKEFTRLRDSVDELRGMLAQSALWVDGEPPSAVLAALEALRGNADALDERAAERTHERAFRLLVETIPAVVWRGTADGDLDYLNQRAVDYFGHTAQGLAGGRWLELVHPDNREATVRRWLHSAETGAPYEDVYQIRRADGEYRWIQSVGEPLRDRDGRIIHWCGVIIDIDERKRTEDALRESERELRLGVDSIPGLVATFTPSGELEFANREMLEYFGKSLEELKGWGTDDTVHLEQKELVTDRFAKSIASGQPFDFESRARDRNGVYRWQQSRGFPLRGTDGRIVRWYNLITDIDERKEAEEALRRSERQLKLTIDTIPALAWSTTPDGSADFFNQHYLDFVGLTAEQASGWGWTVALHPDDVNELAATWQRILLSGELGETEARLRRHDGEYRWFLFRANPLRDEAGRIFKWFGVNADIEDRKRAEEALNKARSELAHVTRVTTLSTLTASIAHEVNQPLSGIVTNASTCLRMLDADPPDVEGARETARRAIRDGHRASEVITGLRALFSRKEFTPNLLDLNAATREVVALSVSELQRRRIVLRLELAEDLAKVTGDRIQLQQVILNLLRNAADAMTDVHDRPRELLIRTEREEGNRVRVIVRDSGVGVDAGTINKLFDAFYTTKHEGMGMGLSVSRSIIERHQGRLWAEPNDGPGCTFAFSLFFNPETVT